MIFLILSLILLSIVCIASYKLYKNIPTIISSVLMLLTILTIWTLLFQAKFNSDTEYARVEEYYIDDNKIYFEIEGKDIIVSFDSLELILYTNDDSHLYVEYKKPDSLNNFLYFGFKWIYSPYFDIHAHLYINNL